MSRHISKLSWNEVRRGTSYFWPEATEKIEQEAERGPANSAKSADSGNAAERNQPA